MPTELQEFYAEFFQDIQRSADAEGQFAEDAFFERFTTHLVDAGELDTADRAYYYSPRGMRVDGYGGDPASADGTLTLLICDFRQTSEIETLTATELDAIFKRAMSFLAKARDASFRRSLEETSPGFGLADLIASSWQSVTKIRLILMSNRRLSSRVDGRKEGEYDGVPVVHSVWDLGRLQRYVASGKAREDILVDMQQHGGALAALPAHLSRAGYEAYLIVVPGTQLASIYDQWGARLLEQNVRVFLQAKGGVNKGIRNTIENAPEMFFAYNNGVTATAEEVVTRRVQGTLEITGLRNLQIVNGGQTTASIYAASRKKDVDLSKVFVQMKLSIIPPALAETVVPRISEYANSQNKVNAADFFANHPYHLRMKDFSQRIYAPSRDGTFRESKWFYERARGQYQDARSGLSVAQQRAFEMEYPKRQVFAKTDLAKYLAVWQGLPHVVSKGAQKNFAAFAEFIGKQWSDNPDQFNESYFRHSIAKAIVFQKTEELVTRQPWYEGGYRANIVAYAIAKLSHDVAQMGREVDFDHIWRLQDITPALQSALTVSAAAVKDVIIDPPAGTKNVTEWAKQPACWNRVASLRVDWPRELLDELISGEQRDDLARDARKDQRVLNGIEAQTAVVQAGAATWRAVQRWGVAKKLLSQKEIEILEVACSIPSKIPTDKQSLIVLKTLQKLQAEGCQIGAEVN